MINQTEIDWRSIVDIIDALRLTDVDENNYSSQLKCIEGESDTNEFDDNYE
ncbi:hypothetical protein [Psychrobacillus sp. FSL K6-1415]|uniref:hypothetical protein n=1 Tax=Psychrobacillus sp. FSL K6-1415 TaxID=2921544 RepID=UPI0030FB7E3F